MKQFISFFLIIVVAGISFANSEIESKFNEVTDKKSVGVYAEDRLILMHGSDILILHFNEVAQKEEKDILIEECSYEWVLITPNDVKIGSDESNVVWSIEKVDADNYNLTESKGTEKIKIGTFELSWTYMQLGSAYIDVPKGYKWTKIPK